MHVNTEMTDDHKKCHWDPENCSANKMYAADIQNELTKSFALLPCLWKIVSHYAEGPWRLRWNPLKHYDEKDIKQLDPDQSHHLMCLFPTIHSKLIHPK